MTAGYKKILSWIITAVAMVAVLYHLLYTQKMILGPIEHQNFHYMLALVLVFLCSIRDSKTALGKITAVILLACALFATNYIFVEYTALEQERAPILALTDLDMVVGFLMVGLGLEASRRAFGYVFPLVALVFIAYAFWGHNLPGPLEAPNLDTVEIITQYVMGLNGGMFGSVLGISANYVFLFVVFGGVLGVTGASEFFNQIGAYAGRKMAGGPAISSVVSSALMGSVTGSVMANVATTGAFTIPLMKKVGYKPHQAGAIEAAASSGGQIMPPVMGATAFIMAEMAETPYVDVMMAALIPSIFYFFSVGVYAQLQAKKLRIGAAEIESGLTLKRFLMDAPLFVMPLLIITVILIMGFTPMFTIFWALMALLLLNVWHVWATHGNFSKLWQLIPAFTDGACSAARIAVSCAVLGPIITTMTLTGLGVKIPSIIAMWCGGHLFVALLLTAFVCIVLGMGLPTMAAYLLVGMVGAPTLINLGVPQFQAHMFVFVFAVFSCITPPIAVAAIPAAALAETGYLRTAFESTKVGWVGFLIPFIIIYTPELLLGQDASGGIMCLVYTFIALLAIILFAVAIVGYARKDVPMPIRFVTFGGCVALLYGLFGHSMFGYGIGFACIAVLVLTQLGSKRISSPE